MVVGNLAKIKRRSGILKYAQGQKKRDVFLCDVNIFTIHIHILRNQNTPAFLLVRGMSDTAQHTHGGIVTGSRETGRAEAGELNILCFHWSVTYGSRSRTSHQRPGTRHKDQGPETRGQRPAARGHRPETIGEMGQVAVARG